MVKNDAGEFFEILTLCMNNRNRRVMILAAGKKR
jgi:hypothetical protein